MQATPPVVASQSPFLQSRHLSDPPIPTSPRPKTPRVVAQSMPIYEPSPPLRSSHVNLPSHDSQNATHIDPPPTRPGILKPTLSERGGQDRTTLTRETAAAQSQDCMFCRVCPQHQSLLAALLSPPRSSCACAPPAPVHRQFRALPAPTPPAAPKITTLPYTPTQLMCMSGDEPWMNSHFYIQRPFY
ncbi:hypothetical protein C8R43DRAFT_1023008 [Mycena crocata]|nr:hypothetical protein C8R43DRAFT_1023008 [Mycena crocata]